MRTWVIFNTKMQALPAATLLPRITGQENLVEGAAFRRVVTTEGREVGTRLECGGHGKEPESPARMGGCAQGRGAPHPAEGKVCNLGSAGQQ